MSEKKIKVMIVDDAPYIRFLLSNYLNADPEIEVIATAEDGIDALEKLKTLKPDVITLDIEMPRMDGIGFLKAIMTTNPIPTIILSSLNPHSSTETVKALQYGALDFVNKDTLQSDAKSTTKKSLIEKIKIAKTAKIKKTSTAELNKEQPLSDKKNKYPFKITKAQIIAIGCSTGGPRALHQLIPELPSNLPASIVIVQHIPAGFSTSLANRLNEISDIDVKEAEDGDFVLPGRVLLAPGDYHMEITKDYTVRLSQGKRVNHVRPSVDVLYDSLCDIYGSNIIGIILTGMGQDGADGAEKIKKLGGHIIAESEETCTIFGMPKVVISRNLADDVLPLHRIPQKLISIFKEKGEL